MTRTRLPVNRSFVPAVDRVRRQDRLQSEWSPVVAIGRDGDDERDLCAAEVSRRRQLVRAMSSGDS